MIHFPNHPAPVAQKLINLFHLVHCCWLRMGICVSSAWFHSFYSPWLVKIDAFSLLFVRVKSWYQLFANFYWFSSFYKNFHEINSISSSEWKSYGLFSIFFHEIFMTCTQNITIKSWVCLRVSNGNRKPSPLSFGRFDILLYVSLSFWIHRHEFFIRIQHLMKISLYFALIGVYELLNGIFRRSKEKNSLKETFQPFCKNSDVSPLIEKLFYVLHRWKLIKKIC